MGERRDRDRDRAIRTGARGRRGPRSGDVERLGQDRRAINGRGGAGGSADRGLRGGAERRSGPRPRTRTAGTCTCTSTAYCSRCHIRPRRRSRWNPVPTSCVSSTSTSNTCPSPPRSRPRSRSRPCRRDSADLPEERLDVLDEELGLLVRPVMPAAVVRVPRQDVREVTFREPPDRLEVVLEVRQADRNR